MAEMYLTHKFMQQQHFDKSSLSTNATSSKTEKSEVDYEFFQPELDDDDDDGYLTSLPIYPFFFLLTISNSSQHFTATTFQGS